LSVHASDATSISRRYATAIFALAAEAKSDATVVGEMEVLARAITGHAPLAETLANPLVSNSQKAKVLAVLISKADTLTQRAVAIVAEGGRASLIPAISTRLSDMLREAQGEVEAVVTSARALSATTKKQLLQSLTKATGKTVKLNLKEDASVLGGLRVEVGSMRLDATLAGALNAMREQLFAPTH
jgi:F-type H+-transporting ATPase subunit delta